MNAFTKCKKKKKISVTMARILGNTFFYGSEIEYKKKDSSQPSMIAILVNSGSMSLQKKNKRKKANEWECIYCGTT